ncbi:hypothetical protein AVEN_258670-1, partial [Araneus ventricosus]
MTRNTHSPSLKALLVARLLTRWQACSGTVQDGGNAGEEFLRVGICEVLRLRAFGVHSYANTENLHLVICSTLKKL